MKRTTTTLLASALLLGAASVSAQTDPTPRKPFGTGELPEFLKAYDADGNGKLSVEERQAAEKALREAKLNRPGVKHPADTNGDGKVDADEQEAARKAIAAKMEEARIKRFSELDADGNDLLTAGELKAIPRITDEMVARMIAHLDKDADGKVSQDEFLAVLKPVAPPIPPFPLPEPLPIREIVCSRVLAAFDVDHNGRLSAKELEDMKAALDTNKDGKISFDEWKAYVLANPVTQDPVGPGAGNGG